ncbi:MAG: DNA polymerase I [Cyclobacteriaceae bacterium]|nr:MAG: DNA polymerase I [Cyclobacteriaceae bacterium]
MTNSKKKLFLLDAMALIYRAHFAFSRTPRINSKGFNTGASLGFTNSLLEIIQKQKPTHIAVAFDTFEPTFRHEKFEEYKAQRQAMPEDVRTNIPWVKKIVRGFNIPVLELDGYEADDIIGTFATQAASAGMEVFMMTPDKDFAQLVKDNVFLYKPSYMGNAVDIMGVPEVLKKWDIENVTQVTDILGLQGDASDNIPGIPGVGAKTAVKYVKQYGSVENLVAHAHELKGKQKEMVTAYGDQGILSKELATINVEVPLTFDESELAYTGPDKETLTDIFDELEFRTLIKRVMQEKSAKDLSKEGTQMGLFNSDPPEALPAQEQEPLVAAKQSLTTVIRDYHLLQDAELIESLIDHLKLQKMVCLQAITDESGAFLGLALCYCSYEAYFIPQTSFNPSLVEQLNQVFQNKSLAIVGHDLKSSMLVLKALGIQLEPPYWDTMVAHYVMDPETSHTLRILADVYLNYEVIEEESLLGSGRNKTAWSQVPLAALKDYLCETVDLVLQLKSKIQLEEKLKEVYEEIELPLIGVLTSMEYQGIKVDPEVLGDLSIELEKESLKAQQEIFKIAGEEFNIASPKQLGEILFDKLKLVEKPKKTRTGQYATGEEILVKLADEHEIVASILDFRVYQKLKSTYVDALPLMISDRDGRIHSTFSQAVAATGRLSSNNPNLQNIPIRTEKGREIRKAFVPRDASHVLMSADYSQIELRIAASFAKDQDMIAAFKEGRDIHATTASKVFKVDLDEVDANMRRKAKAVNFGLLYGMSAFGLSERLKVPRAEAKEIMEAYFEEFSAVKEYMDRIIEQAREAGYVETITGRRRYLRDINSRNYTLRSYAERNAINAPIQGSAADIIKVAMIKIEDWIKAEKLRSKMVLQVHDELVFDVHQDELEQLKLKVETLMKDALPLEVPMEIEIGVGKNWLEAH